MLEGQTRYVQNREDEGLRGIPVPFVFSIPPSWVQNTLVVTSWISAHRRSHSPKSPNRTMENLFRLPCLSRSPTSDLIVPIVEKEPAVIGDGKALSEVPPTGTTLAFSCAGDARHRHTPERELVVLAGADNTYDGDGENSCGQGGDPMGSESPATWADTCPTGPKYVKQPRQDSAGTVTPAAACSGVVCEMIAAPPCAREAGRTTPLFGTYGSSSIGASKSVNGSRAADISSMQSFDGEDPAIMIMSHQNGCHGGSSSGSDITSEDWLHVAETVLAHVEY